MEFGEESSCFLLVLLIFVAKTFCKKPLFVNSSAIVPGIATSGINKKGFDRRSGRPINMRKKPR
jgi:hypothetical protein